MSTNLNDFEIENGVLKKYKGRDRDLVIPDGVTVIDDYAFQSCQFLKSVDIPDGVISIGDKAFRWCHNLTNINIPDGVTSIGESAFNDCLSLTSINIPDSVTSIGDGAFQGCSGLESITIPDGVTSIGQYTYAYCKSLTSINIPDGVTSIGKAAFKECTSLTSINISNGVTSIDESAFTKCTSLTSITIPDSVTRLDAWVFDGCLSLKSINIPNGVVYIGVSAFSESVKDIYYKGTEQQWNNIDIKEHYPNVKVHFNCKYSNDLSEIEKEVRKLLSEGKSEKEVYQSLKSKGNVSDNDIVEVLLRTKPDSSMVVSFCDKVILPNISSLFSTSNGRSKYTVGEVARMLYKKYPESLVNKAIISVLDKEYLVD